MLKQRIATALVLAAIFLAVLFFAPWQGFALFTGLVFGLAAWEWANLSGYSSLFSRIVYTFITVIIAIVIATHNAWFFEDIYLKKILLGSGVWWALALLWVQGYPSSVILWRSKWVRALMGWSVLLPAWFACLYLNHMENGDVAVLSVVLIVAAADIGAYFAGRAFGKHKLAPNVSPGKTWEGVLGGLLANTLLLFALMYLWDFPPQDWMLFAMLVFPASLVSVLGDLLESMVKRHRGIKDSGHILPGHGGVMDRIDGLVAAAPVFLLSLMLLGMT